MVKFEVADRGQGPSWWLSENGELLAWPGRYFASMAFAEREAAAFKAAAVSATFEIFRSSEGWRWRAVQPVDYFMAYSPGAFTRPAQARKAGREIRHKVQRAVGP